MAFNFSLSPRPQLQYPSKQQMLIAILKTTRGIDPKCNELKHEKSAHKHINKINEHGRRPDDKDGPEPVYVITDVFPFATKPQGPSHGPRRATHAIDLMFKGKFYRVVLKSTSGGAHGFEAVGVVHTAKPHCRPRTTPVVVSSPVGPNPGLKEFPLTPSQYPLEDGEAEPAEIVDDNELAPAE